MAFDNSTPVSGPTVEGIYTLDLERALATIRSLQADRTRMRVFVKMLDDNPDLDLVVLGEILDIAVASMSQRHIAVKPYCRKAVAEEVLTVPGKVASWSRASDFDAALELREPLIKECMGLQQLLVDRLWGRYPTNELQPVRY